MKTLLLCFSLILGIGSTVHADSYRSCQCVGIDGYWFIQMIDNDGAIQQKPTGYPDQGAASSLPCIYEISNNQQCPEYKGTGGGGVQ